MPETTRRSAMHKGGLTLALALVAPPAWAQTAPPAPPQSPDLPSRQLPSTPAITRPGPTPAPQATVSVDSRGALAQSSCPFEDSAIRLRIAAVRFTRPDGSPLQPAIAMTLGGLDTPSGDQPIKVICDLRDRANAALRKDGWVASVQIPAQSIDGGELALQVVTARITEVRVRGAPGPYRDLLERRLKELRGLDPLNQNEAERALLLTNDVPGLDVQLSLRPAGTLPGDVIGDLLVAYRPYAVLANAQNYNSRALGRETGYVRGELYGISGLSDVLYLGASSTADFQEQIIVQGGYTVGFGSGGTTIGPRGVYAWSRPDLDQLKLETKTLIAGFDIVQPIQRSLNTNVRLALGFDFVDQDTTVATSTSSAAPLNVDRLRILSFRLSGETGKRRLDGTFAFQLGGDLEVRKGLDIFDATPRNAITTGPVPSRIDGEARAVVIRGEIEATAALDRIFSISGRARGQWADDPLLNYEEFSLGNLTVGSGYDPGSNSGDRGLGVRAELAARLPIKIADVDAQLFGFYDAVWLTNLDRNAIEVDRTLRSFGGGMRLRVFRPQLFLEATYAHPTDRALTIDKAPPTDRFLLSLTAKFDARAR